MFANLCLGIEWSHIARSITIALSIDLLNLNACRRLEASIMVWHLSSAMITSCTSSFLAYSIILARRDT